jgi:hypothetical protein
MATRQSWLRQTHGPCDDRQFEAVWQACETTCALYEGLRAAQRLPFEYRVVQELVCQELEHIEHLEQSVSALEETIRPPARVVPALVGFYAGVEIGQAAVVGTVWPPARDGAAARNAAVARGSVIAMAAGVGAVVARVV